MLPSPRVSFEPGKINHAPQRWFGEWHWQQGVTWGRPPEGYRGPRANWAYFDSPDSILLTLFVTNEYVSAKFEYTRIVSAGKLRLGYKVETGAAETDAKLVEALNQAVEEARQYLSLLADFHSPSQPLNADELRERLAPKPLTLLEQSPSAY